MFSHIFLFLSLVLLQQLKGLIEGFQNENLMLFTRLMDKLSTIQNAASKDDDIPVSKEELTIISTLPCEDVVQLKTIEKALSGNSTTFKKLLVCKLDK